ncbi:tautomerase [Deinococcus aerolatus]|uniref:Tautomerase n=1 Tax=Deinococcus aerolatus TaxID=522487 RepID=A0ABQ2G9J9_9DEIO|nr:4-oxalocrotonate tautomerase family protein [Deinococcus aerolatus]GGL81926.1 tautomerase [Deinococcus aerolatus]
MPHTNVRQTRKDITTEQKAQIVREITATLQSLLGKRPESVHVVIDEVEPENCGHAGELASEHRKRQP